MPTATFNTLKRESYFKNPPKDKAAYPLLSDAISPHIGSFDALSDLGLLDLAAKDIGKISAFDSTEPGKIGNKVSFWIESVHVSHPTNNDAESIESDRRLLPAECRERLITYRSTITLNLCYQVNDSGEVHRLARDCGQIPIMLKSNRCHLQKMSPYQLVQAREEVEELGGYFIVNGIEKLIRMLIVQRRNIPLAIVRPSFTNRGKHYSKFGVQIRSVRPDQTSQTNVLHYLEDGNITFRFSYRKNEYLVPVMMILRALIPTNDRDIFTRIVGNDTKNSFLTNRVELLLKTYKIYKLYTQEDTLNFLGKKFRVALNGDPDMSDYEIGQLLLKKIVLVHLNNDTDKYRMLIFMIRKLYSVVGGFCAPDNPDAVQHQEVLLGGFLYGMIIKEKMEEYLQGIRGFIRSEVTRKSANVDFSNPDYIRKAIFRSKEPIGTKLTYFLSTGNLVSQSGLDLQQTSGYTVVAEKINFYRFISHFRMVHRGSFFAQLKTTTVRKLLPESWGFLCPVHTPDGSPCGLLNHLAHKCRVVTTERDVSKLPKLLFSLGVIDPDVVPPTNDYFSVQLDGRIIGWCEPALALKISQTLRLWKTQGLYDIPLDLEIGYVPYKAGGQYPGLYLFSSLARMTRPVKYLPNQSEDYVGPFEQVHMDIAVTPEEITPKVHTHVEFSPTNILSILANLTPFSDFNQSPRNMYQCQMGKQTMGTPGTALNHRSDNKLYRLQTGQTPVVRASLYDEYGMDSYPNGMNAVVAVISYTGYDMDDAMILNKSALERGFGHGTVYKVEKVDLSERQRPGEPTSLRFGFAEETVPETVEGKLDRDGLPIIGVHVQEGDPIAAYIDPVTNRTKYINYKSSEAGYIEEVKLVCGEGSSTEFQTFTIKFRVPRVPVIGDKFSSRHGQKGVCSQKYPTVNMPFSESGIQPDIIINPHAFPSRMTIGMFVESLAGKSGALHGVAQEATPWQFSEDYTAADHFGEQLLKAGYNYHGNEPMYSGITGEEFKVDIYIGVVYYQRLRHMVNDKYQVRSTGPVNVLTMQPVKGRKRHGGIRVGEMERDALIGHGSSFLLRDRLLNCSDYTVANLCRSCGSLITSINTVARIGQKSSVRCRSCATPLAAGDPEDDLDSWEDGLGNRFKGGDNTTAISIPFVLRYLDSELLSMGVQMKFSVNPA
ncbi:hypothetical protein CANCADRAFT_71761 [Tortispora caseinolytica NRRL Y-17796]|uniref:DNA-directed RNA polymerase subunit beta n=1 Tax=Tortispora caseinolytica NRRL Y-17796 TaxID=767744 RepID=A0A1E4TIB9_9ASCO|nr:hypothetical protein CANCADRAFT_71761 [Tortispora caseinolytica NRRL Y-17796]